MELMTLQKGTFGEEDNIVMKICLSQTDLLARERTMLTSPGKKTVFDVVILKRSRCPYKAGGGHNKKIYINGYPDCLRARVLTEPVYC